MKTKSKLQSGFWLLFGLVILGGALSLYYLNQIANSTKTILKDNYDTLVMTREMRTVLDENNLPFSESAVNKFNEELVKEENNITEKGEAAAVARLRQSFENVRNNSLTMEVRQQEARSVRVAIKEIEVMNMEAIVRKNKIAQKAIKDATFYLGLIGSITFLILFSFMFNLPDLITARMEEQTV